MRDLRDRALAFEATHHAELDRVDPALRDSARNFLHYLSVRQQDIRALQRELHACGLSSLGGPEAHVLASLDAVLTHLALMDGAAGPARPPATPLDALAAGPALLRAHTERLLGPAPAGRSARIMVTMPSEAATDEGLLVDLLRAGMDVMRINCAHDDATAWRAMARNLRRAESIVGRTCLIQVDLAGPKLRTGAIAATGRFVRIRPARDAIGRVVSPARVLLVPDRAPAGVNPPRAAESPYAAVLPIPGSLLRRAAPGDALRVQDARGGHRALTLDSPLGAGWLAHAERTVSIAQGARCTLRRAGDRIATGAVGTLPEVVLPIALEVGDRLVLTRDAAPGAPAVIGPDGATIEPARIPCTLAAAFDRTEVGQAVWLDDGRIGGTVERSDGSTITIRLTQTPPGGARLRAGKGINLPDTDLALDALTEQDRADLAEVCGIADLVAMSFLRTPHDVELLQQALNGLGAGRLGIVLKIENATAFRNLPRILLASMRAAPAGVMVARGDLAVEIGFGRLSEVQEEILWLCEAAHVPVIWATQVLEALAKGGAPTRAEISDAVMSSRAECVMLNKGPRIVETVAFLAELLGRMDAHHDKQMALLRPLSVCAF